LKCDIEQSPDTLKKSSGKMKSDVVRPDPLNISKEGYYEK